MQSVGTESESMHMCFSFGVWQYLRDGSDLRLCLFCNLCLWFVRLPFFWGLMLEKKYIFWAFFKQGFPVKRFALLTMIYFTLPMFSFILIGSVLFGEHSVAGLSFGRDHKIWREALNKPWENLPSTFMLFTFRLRLPQGGGGLPEPLRGAVGRRQSFTSEKMIRLQRKLGNRS